MKIGDKCGRCEDGKVELVSGTAPWDPDHLQCPVCDSTYNITPAFAYDMKEQIDKLREETSRLRDELSVHEVEGLIMQTYEVQTLTADRDKLQKQRTDLRQVLAEMLGAAETDCLDDKSNVWRSLMITARETLEAS
jgi:hypothetical protein